MLCGVGGRTVAEAKENVSYGEFCSWLQYRNKRGSLNTGWRTEYGFGLLATLIVNALKKDGKKAEIYDFAPHADRPDVEDELMRLFGGK